MPNTFNVRIAAMLLAAILVPPFAKAAPEHWVTTWHASAQPIWGPEFVLPTNVPLALEGQTVREIVKVSAGGKQLRLVFSNRYGQAPLDIGEVRIAISKGGAAIDAATGKLVTFNGQRAVTVPPGAPVTSDPVAFDLAPLAEVAVSTYFPGKVKLATFHWGGQQTAYAAKGSQAAVQNLPANSPMKGRFFLTSILADAPSASRTVVTLGDSITDGNGSTPDRNRRWPDYLAQRFAGANVAVANAGISGARVLGDRMGDNAMARFDQDVLAQPGVKTVIVFMGINDIGWPGSPFAPRDDQLRAEQLIAGYKQLIAKARTHKLRVIGATLLPFEGALRGTPFEGHYSLQKEAVRQSVNTWIRTSGGFDEVVDFDALLRDPDHPSRLLPKYDSGDHLHPGDAGYKAMADVFTLDGLFRQ